MDGLLVEEGKVTAPTDRTLQRWWRRAVIAIHGERCVLCGRQPVECHHIVKRRHMVLRHDPKNGVPLCVACHPVADTIDGRAAIEAQVDIEYLRDMEFTRLKDWLQSMGMTRTEFLAGELEELKRIVREAEL